MKRAVVISRVVLIEAVLHHLVDEPAVDTFVEVGRLDPEQEKAKRDPEGEDEPWRPAAFGDAGAACFDPATQQRKIRQRDWF